MGYFSPNLNLNGMVQSDFPQFAGELWITVQMNEDGTAPRGDFPLKINYQGQQCLTGGVQVRDMEEFTQKVELLCGDSLFLNRFKANLLQQGQRFFNELKGPH